MRGDLDRRLVGIVVRGIKLGLFAGGNGFNLASKPLLGDRGRSRSSRLGDNLRGSSGGEVRLGGLRRGGGEGRLGREGRR